MRADVKPMKYVTIITDRGKGDKTIQFLNDRGYNMHTANLGHGTAPDDIAAKFSLGEKEKIIISLVADVDRCAELMAALKEYMKPGDGIAFSVPLSSVSNMEALKFITSVN